METTECAWKDLFDDSERKSLNEGLYLTGLTSITLGIWLNLAILMSTLNFNRSYRNLANFTLVASIRRMLPLTAHFTLFSFFERENLDFGCCEFCAFLDTFLAVYEIEWLTHVCIERYVLAKYTTNGWPIQNCHYVLFQRLCLFFASLYSIPPLFGIGRYGFDFSCSSGTFDVILPQSWKRWVVVAIFLLRSIKPALVMLMMLIWARILEKKFVSDETREQVKFTKSVIIMALVNEICWTPIALIRGSVILSQLMSSLAVVPVSAYHIKWAMLIHWMSPALTSLVLFAADSKIREKMLRLHSNTTADDNKDKIEYKEKFN